MSDYPKLGFVHIPKTAGTALAHAISATFDIEREHLTQRELVKADIEQSPRITELKAKPFLAGHVKPAMLRKLGCSKVFTVLRDPRLKLASEYAYLTAMAKRRPYKKLLPLELAVRSQSLVDWLKNVAPDRMCRWLFVLPMERRDKAIKWPTLAANAIEVIQLMRHQLAGFDAVYACLPQRVLDDLLRRGLIKPAIVHRQNVTSWQDTLTVGATEADFIDHVNAASQLDMLAYRQAMDLYPNTVVDPLLSDEALIATMKDRYGFAFD